MIALLSNIVFAPFISHTDFSHHLHLKFTSGSCGCQEAKEDIAGLDIFTGAVEAQLRSPHTGSSLPLLLQRKFPCLGIENASRQPHGLTKTLAETPWAEL